VNTFAFPITFQVNTLAARAFVLGCVLAICGCQNAEAGAAKDEAFDDTERLLAQPPKGWPAVFASNRPGVRIAEYVPPGESASEWTEKLSFESFGGEPLPDPIGLLVEIARDQEATCTGFSDRNTFSGLENGYPTSVRLFVCRNNSLTQKGQITLVKAIQGAKQVYVITHAQRVPPIESDAVLPIAQEDMARWSRYLGAISLCDSADEAHPCPPGEAD
jgi:hypothetical protein